MFLHSVFLVAFIPFAFQFSVFVSFVNVIKAIFIIIIIIIIEIVNVIINVIINTYIFHFLNCIRSCSRMGLKERYTFINLCPPRHSQKHTCRDKAHHKCAQ